ncbi:MAG: hypothetical protein E6R07_05320 [Nevskiaceae bacterium]|nr:MAG: hypothetical protein E6R07_05320 [Nevskiaceae bacterium]
MLTELMIQLSPAKMVLSGLLFFWASWMATKKFLILAIIGLTAGETSWSALQGQADAIGSNPLVLKLASAANMPINHGSALAALIANILLALSMMALVQAMRTYVKAKRADMETELSKLDVQGNSRLTWRQPSRR